VFGDRLDAVVAYDVDRAVVFAARIAPADLSALAPLVEVWHREGVQTPLLMTGDEFRRSLDAFPLEYQAIADRHVLITGSDPFAGLSIRDEDIRRACEVQAKAHLIHLRQGWLEAAGDTRELTELMQESAAPWRILIENVARLRDVDVRDRAHLIAWTSSVTGMSAELCDALLTFERQSDTAARELAARLPEYVAGAEQLWATIDSWRL
jgi:hypothetical protein